MKSIVKILALYIMVLSFVPCDDVLASSFDDSTIEFLSQEHEDSHSHDSDLCSPFCSCDCCQTEAEQIAVLPTPLGELISNDLQVMPIYFIEKDLFFSFWNPPKL